MRPRSGQIGLVLFDLSSLLILWQQKQGFSKSLSAVVHGGDERRGRQYKFSRDPRDKRAKTSLVKFDWVMAGVPLPSNELHPANPTAAQNENSMIH